MLKTLKKKLTKQFKKRDRKPARRLRSFEVLEDRLALNSAPIMTNLPDEITLYAGTSYHLAITGSDADLDQITYQIADGGSLSGLETSVPTGRSVSITYSQKIDGALQTLGTVVFQLFEEDAPLSSTQFATLVEQGFYEGLTVHRVVDNFMFQGGDPTGTGGGYSSLDNVADEHVDYLQHSSAGIVAFANSNNAASGRYNTSNCQFYIMDAPYPYLDGGYNVFAFVTSGTSVCETISGVETEYNSSGEKSKPVQKITMSDVSLFQDYENGVLRLNAVDAATGSTTITVSATDEAGNVVYKEIKVNIISSSSADSLTASLPDKIVLSAGTEKVIELPENFGQSGVSYSVSSDDLPSGVTATVEKNKIVISDTTNATQSFSLTLTATGAVETTKSIDVFVAQLGDFELPEQIDMNSGETETITIVVPQEYLDQNVELKVDADSLPEGFSVSVLGEEIQLTAVGDFAQVVQVDFYLSTDSNVRQTVDVFVTPKAPILTLERDSDSGAEDGITKINNVGETLKFSVSGVYNEAELQIWITTGRDSSPVEFEYEVVSKNLSSETNLYEYQIALLANDASRLADGDYSIFASQSFPIAPVYDHESLVSPSSNLIDLTVDTVELEIVSTVEDVYKLTVDKEFSLSVETNKTDAEGNPRFDLTFDIQSDSPLPENLKIENGVLSWTPSDDDIGWEYSLTIVVTDGAGFQAEKETILTLASGPDFEIVGETTVAELETLTLNVLVDPDEYSGEYSLEILSTTLPEGSEYSFEAIENGKSFVWTTTESDGPGEYSVIFKLTTIDDDGNSAYTVKGVSIKIEEANLSPSIDFDATNPIDVWTEQLYEVVISATDGDLPAQTLTFSLGDDAPEGMTIDAATGRLSWTPTNDQGGNEYEATVRVEDGEGGSDEKTIRFVVNKTDNAPVFEPIETQTVKTGETLSLTVVATDPNGTNSIEYSLSGDDLPEGITIDATTGVLTWNVPTDLIADSSVLTRNWSIVVVATEITGQNEDGTNVYGLSSSTTVSIDVENAGYIDPEAVDNTKVESPTELGTIASWSDWVAAWRANAEYRFAELARSSSRLMTANASATETKTASIAQSVQNYQNGTQTKTELLEAVAEAESTYQKSLKQYIANHQTRTEEIERLAAEQQDELVGIAATLDSEEGYSLEETQNATDAYFNDSSDAWVYDAANDVSTPIDLKTTAWYSPKPIPLGLFQLSSVSFEVAVDSAFEDESA